MGKRYVLTSSHWVNSGGESNNRSLEGAHHDLRFRLRLPFSLITITAQGHSRLEDLVSHLCQRKKRDSKGR
jgi:hypothetical protein